jgi:hypothetical protein
LEYADLTDEQRRVVDAVLEQRGMTPQQTATPTRKTSEAELDRWNQAWRSSPQYREALRLVGADPNRKIKLSGNQQEQIERYLASVGMPLPKGMKIDNAGNLNQTNTLVKNIAKGAAIGGAAATGLGAFGIGPLAGVMGTGAAASGAGASGAIPGIAAGTLPGGASAAGGSTFSTLAGLAGVGSKAKDFLGAAGGALGGAADAMASNRGVALDAAATQEQLDQQRQANRSNLVDSAFKRELHGAYLSDPNRGRSPGVAGKYSRPITPTSVDPEAIAKMRAEAQRTLTDPGSPFAFDAALLRPSTGETLAGWGGAAATVAGAVPASWLAKLGKLIR